MTSLALGMFSHCSALKSIYIPASVSLIKHGVFSNCTGLKKVYWGGSSQPEIVTSNNANDLLLEAQHFYNVKPEHFNYKMTLSSKPAANGLTLSWNRPSWEVKTIIERLENGTYKQIATATGKDTYTISAALAGGTQSYRVTVFSTGDLEMDNFSGALNNVLYLAQPTVKAANASTGAKISWSKVAGATEYRLYYKTTGGWKNLTTVGNKSSYIWKNAKSGTTYKFAVRAKKDSTLSSYNKNGTALTYLAQPVLSKVWQKGTSIGVTWKKVSGASSYAIYRKQNNGGWKKIGTSTTSGYWDKSSKKKGVKYTYTVRAVKKSTLSSYYTKGKSIVYK